MSSILYYSNFCENSKILLSNISKSNVKNDIHFICIDKRIQKNNETYIILENGQHIILPKTITAVPALLLINQNYKILLGNEITEYLKPDHNPIVQQKEISHDLEPTAFSMNNSIYGVNSDNYSFLDQNSDELSAKGNGGLRQMYNYASLNHNDKINTPPDDYIPDKVNEGALEQYQNERNNIK